MGVVESVGFLHFPRQGSWLGKRTSVCFNYDTLLSIGGTFVRDDAEKPHLSIIHLDDGRFVLTTECQHTPPFDTPPTPESAPKTDTFRAPEERGRQ